MISDQTGKVGHPEQSKSSVPEAGKADAVEQSWASLPEEELLKKRIRDLGLSIDRPTISERIQRLYDELRGRGLIHFRPGIYLGDEWFSPEGEPEIAVPFVFAHPRLMELEKKHLFELEGEDPLYFMKILRHETGHVFDHCFRVSKKRKWRKLFGSPEEAYDPDHYRPKPYSRSYVRNLDNWYAQSHPDEDFAETFAVWLDPEVDWRKQYARWPIALEKLRFVNDLAQELANLPMPSASKGGRICDATRMNATLATYLARKKKALAHEAPDFYDDDLRRIFNGGEDRSLREYGAARFMKRRRRQILDAVSFWTREKKYTIDRILSRFVARCEELGLRVGRSEEEVCLEVAAYLATMMTHYFFTGRLKSRP